MNCGTALHVACGALLAAFITGCSGTDAAPSGPAGGADPKLRERPKGPGADASEELSGGNGPFMAAGAGFVLPPGYVDHEYVLSGTATAYAAKGALTDDGRWTVEPATPTAEYRTRILVRRPDKPADASGTVVFEWLNVSGGVDANAEYVSLEEEIIRRGHIWIGVSAQLIGVEGGPVLVSVPVTGVGDLAGKGLKAIDPDRYGSLSHPGDGYSFDIFTQAARAVLENGELLGGAKPKILIAAGESQSAFALTSYYDGVQPLTLMFDGFFVHSRGSASLPFVAPGASADLAGALTGASHPILRDDLDAPAMELQTESDVAGILSSSSVRQPDTDRFRLWEVAGTSHADAHLVGPTASAIDCGAPINNGPLHLVAKAAFRGLDTWVRTGEAPPTAPLIELDASGAQALRDADGIALGGIRTPPVDVPVDVLSGAPGPSSSVICLLMGSSKPLPAERIAELYATRAAYQEKYDAATNRTIEAGFVLDADRGAMTEFSDPSAIGPGP